MMAEPMFPERRTRSQLMLPDEILQIPQRSPLKDAKTALRNHGATPDTTTASKQSPDDTDDELLLSPGKNPVEIRKASTSKRSASPDLDDGYERRSGSPSDGRELKRVKRDAVPENGESDAENVKVARVTQQRLTQGHARNHSEPNLLAGRRSARKRSATTSKKPLSTASDGPPTKHFSPANSPKKGRAQSVPLFCSTDDWPRIDFRNPPPSPKRSKSPSRSPAKDKLRIASGPFPKSSSLPTIQDEATTAMDEETSSVQEEIELPLVTISPSEGVVGNVIAETTTEPPSSSTSITSSIPSAPSTAVTPPIPTIVPATPMTQSLNKLMPMSPLTPVPETPFPGFEKIFSHTHSRSTGNTGWNANLFAEVANPPTTAGPSTSKSRLPRPSVVPTTQLMGESSKPSTMGPPATTTTKKVGLGILGTAIAGSKKDLTKKGKDAFDIMMKGPREAKARLEKEKAKPSTTQGAAQSSQSSIQSIFSYKGKEKEKVVPVEKPKKMKEKMRPREKPKTHKAPLLIPLTDDEESPLHSPVENKFPGIPPHPAVQSSEPREPNSPLPPADVEDDAVMADADDIVLPTPVAATETLDHDTTMAGLETPIDEFDAENDVIQPPLTSSPDPIPTAETDTIDAELGLPSAEKLTTPNEGQTKEEESPTAEAPEPSTAGPSKLALGKKRQPSSALPAPRMTRSVSKRNEKVPEEPKSKPAPAGRKKASPSAAPKVAPQKRTASGTVKKAGPPARHTKYVDTDPVDEDSPLPPGSPMRLSSPSKDVSKSPGVTKDSLKTIGYGAGTLSLASTPTKSRFSVKPASSPSPSKIARSTSLFVRPPPSSFTRTFSVDFSQPSTASGSTLSTLENALEKLRMPAPSRASTSMGFNRDTPADGEISEPSRSMDDTTVGRSSVGGARPAGGLQRASTVGAAAFKATNTAASSSKAGSTGKNFVQKPLSMFMSGKGATAGAAASRGTGRTGALGNRTSIFGVGGPVRRTVSKKTNLPMVIGSPIKGGGDTTMQEYNDMEDEDASAQVSNDADIFADPANTSSSALSLGDLEGEGSSKGKEPARPSMASRRVSMVSHALSQSLSALPTVGLSNRGLMGPPATPPSARAAARAASSNDQSTSASGSSPLQEGSSSGIGTRSSSRIAKAAANGAPTKGKGTEQTGRKGAEPAAPPNPAAEALKVLKECVIFVDVKTDEGEEAGSLFVEMLEGVGARVLTSVGKTCTHIVYKNGLMSTLTRYRLLRDPKPIVVGIGWVVECVEQRKRVDETDFIVDLDGVNVAGVNKRRRSLLPKLFAYESDFGMDTEKDDDGDGDQSMDGSTSSVTMDDDLAPLERARRRKNMLTGPRP